MNKPKRQPPIINAPWPLAAFGLFLIGAHFVRVLLPAGLQDVVFFHGALIPERFWSPSESGLAPYSGALAAAAPLIFSGFLHGDWAHVIFNAALVVVLGKPLFKVFESAWPGRGPAASLGLLALFLVSEICGGLVYLAGAYPDGSLSIGASGGVSGFVAALLLLREGPDRWLFSQPFVVASAMFVVANAVLALVAPTLLGTSIAWQAHVGGYIGGALAMRAVLAWIRWRD